MGLVDKWRHVLPEVLMHHSLELVDCFVHQLRSQTHYQRCEHRLLPIVQRLECYDDHLLSTKVGIDCALAVGYIYITNY